MGWLSEIMALCILFSLMYLLLPEGGLKKSVGTMMAIIFSLQILSPVFSFNKDNLANWFLSMKGEQVLSDGTEGDLKQIFDDYEQKCVKEIQTYVLEQEGISACDVKVVVNRDVNSSKMGFIEHIYLYVSFGEPKDLTDSWIKPIEIISGNRWEDENNISKKQNELRNCVSTWLSVDLASVTIFDKEDYRG